MHTILQMPYYDSAMRRKMFSFWSKEKQTEYSSNKLHPEFTNQIWMRDHRGRPFTYSLHILFYHPLEKKYLLAYLATCKFYIDALAYIFTYDRA